MVVGFENDDNGCSWGKLCYLLLGKVAVLQAYYSGVESCAQAVVVTYLLNRGSQQCSPHKIEVSFSFSGRGMVVICGEGIEYELFTEACL